MTGRPFNVEELARVAGISLGLHGARGYDGEPAGLAALAQRLGVSHRYLRALRSRGMTWKQADRFAIALGFHPAEIWPAIWWEDGSTKSQRREVAA